MPATQPIEDSVPKIEDIAVGEDLEFQRRWWRFENIVWFVFLLILIADILGAFGRGWLSKAHASTPDHALTLDYERVARAGTPSIMTLTFGPAAMHNGRLVFYVSDSIVKPLGAQRISPQPAISTLGDDGITYTFPVTQAPAVVQIALEPSFPGSHPFRIALPDEPPIDAKIFVVP
jgi:hypothetical protein